jgi:hypothetical protein
MSRLTRDCKDALLSRREDRLSSRVETFGADAFCSWTIPRLDIYARLAERRRLPALSLYRRFAAYGGLVAYGPDMLDILAIPKSATPAAEPIFRLLPPRSGPSSELGRAPRLQPPWHSHPIPAPSETRTGYRSRQRPS